jgi:starch-binding outer membrane protein, SusD/RagB family
MKKLRYIMLIGMLTTSVSCSDFFEIERPYQAPWNKLKDFERVPIGLYATMFSGHEWGMLFVNERIVKTSMGDDVGFVVNPEWGYTRRTTEFNAYTERVFAGAYRAIAAANNALDFVEENNGNPFEGEREEDIEHDFKRIMGEIYFVRGYAYYVLQTMFGPAYIPGGDNSAPAIPMPTSLAATVEEARNPVIGTTQQVWDLIVSDFQKAKELLPVKYDQGLHPQGYEVRANRFAAAAMLMRSYLQRGEYESALEQCNFIIDQNGGEYDLSEDPIAAFNKSASPKRAKEVIFYAPFYDPNLPRPSHLSVLNHTWDGRQCTWAETYMSFSTVRRLDWMDAPESDTTINLAAKRDKRFSQLMAVRYPQNQHKESQYFDTRQQIRNVTTIFGNKYYRATSGVAGMYTNVPLIRLAEVYLTRSILRLKANNPGGAAADLNVVRERAWDEVVAGEAYTPVTAGEITEQMIHDERLIEFFNEGDRLDYLKAMKVPIPKGDRGEGTDPYTSQNFFWTIPSLELNFNEGL